MDILLPHPPSCACTACSCDIDTRGVCSACRNGACQDGPK